MRARDQQHPLDVQTPLQRLGEIDLPRVLRVAAVALIFLASAGIIPMMVARGGRQAFLLLAPLAAAGLLFLLRWPDAGLVLVVVSSLVVPFSIGTGTQTSLNATFLLLSLLVLVWLFKLVALRDLGVRRVPKPVWPALGLIAAALVAFGFGQFHWFPVAGASLQAQVGGLMIFILSAGTFLMAALNLQSASALKWIVSAFIALAGVYVVGNLVEPVGSLINRFFIPQSVNQSLFWCWFGALGFSQAVFNRRLRPSLRILTGALVLGAVYVTWFMKRDWISGWLPLLLAVGLCLVIARPKLAVPGGLALLVLILLNSQQAAGLVMGGDNAYSLMTRVEAWRTLAGILAANPLFGLGPSNYYWYTQLFPILGYNVTFNSHNNYVDLIAQVGVVGLGFYLWLLWQTGRDVLKAVPLAGDGFERAFLIGCLGGLGATAAAGLLGDWALPFVYNIGMAGFRVSALAWLFMGAAVAVSLRLRGEAREAENHAVLSAGQVQTDR